MKETKEWVDERIAIDTELYVKKMRKIRLHKKLTLIVANTLFVLLVLMCVLCIISRITHQNMIAHTPVKAEDVSFEFAKVPSQTRIISKTESYMKDGIQYYNVSIGEDYVVEMAEDQLELLGEDTACDTEIYLLTLNDNSKSYYKSALQKKSLTIVHVEYFGEENFKYEDYEAYSELAAKYFTYQRYKTIGADDYKTYEVTIPNMLIEKKRSFWDIFSEEIVIVEEQ